MFKILVHVENAFQVLKWKEDNYLLTSAHKMEPRTNIEKKSDYYPPVL